MAGDRKRGLAVGSCLTLTQLIGHRTIRRPYPALARAADLISTPLLRNMGTVGGNLCLDTRCNYYNQTFEWRKAIDFCMKKDGTVCWVAPRSPRCWAVNSSDLAPVAVALAAEYHLLGPTSDRVVPASDFYRNDGIDYVAKRPDEILAEVRLPPTDGWDATYWKLRRHGSFDFPVLGVALDSVGRASSGRGSYRPRCRSEPTADRTRGGGGYRWNGSRRRRHSGSGRRRVQALEANGPTPIFACHGGRK